MIKLFFSLRTRNNCYLNSGLAAKTEIPGLSWQAAWLASWEVARTRRKYATAFKLLQHFILQPWSVYLCNYVFTYLCIYVALLGLGTFLVGKLSRMDTKKEHTPF